MSLSQDIKQWVGFFFKYRFLKSVAIPHLWQTDLNSEPNTIAAQLKDGTNMGREGGTTQNTKKPKMPLSPGEE